MDELLQQLESTGYSWAAFGWAKAPKGDYGVYSLDGENDLIAAGKHAEKAIRLSLDYFTRAIDRKVIYGPRPADGYMTTTPGLYAHFDHYPCKTAIEAALDRANCAWYLNSVQFEDDTGFVHFEWIVEVLG